MSEKRPVYRVVITDDEVMVHAPNGTVQFMGWWASLRLAWWLVRKYKGQVDFDVTEQKS